MGLMEYCVLASVLAVSDEREELEDGLRDMGSKYLHRSPICCSGSWPGSGRDLGTKCACEVLDKIVLRSHEI